MTSSAEALSGPAAAGLATASFMMVAVGLAAGWLGGWAMLVFIGSCLVVGTLVGIRVGRAAPTEMDLSDDGPIGLPEVFRGLALRLVIFLAALIFAAVQAYATGAGLAAGAPGGSAALLVPPVAIAGLALVSARRWTDDRSDVNREQSAADR